MANSENDPLEPAPVDPPDTQGGGGETTEPGSGDATAVDPPETQGGGGKAQ